MVRYFIASGILAVSCYAAIPAYSQGYPADQAMRRGQMTTVQSSFSSSVPLDENSDIASQQLESLRTFYKTAQSSCAEVLATVADSCEIFRLSTNVNVQETATKGRRLTVNGQITMKVEFKAGTGKSAQ
jgi:hypothetical protein